MKKLLLIFLFLYISNAFAYKIVIYTDQDGQAKAKEVQNTFRKTYPFNQFELDIEIKSVPASDLNCNSRYGIARDIGCDSAKIRLESTFKGIDQVFIVKESAVYGGSGGSIPVITSSSPSSMILHEYLHTLGFRDEYMYAASEADKFCGDTDIGPNLVIIKPNPKGYKSDEDARLQHMGQIPWSGSIKNGTPITNNGGSALGTGNVSSSVYATPNNTNSPSTFGSAIGLYLGKTCRNANPFKATWQPGREASIMEFIEAGLGAGNEVTVDKILETRGAKRKAIVPENTISTSPAINSDPRRNKGSYEVIHNSIGTRVAPR